MRLSVFFIFLIFFIGRAQSGLTVSDTLLAFGDVFTGDSLSLQLTLGNTGNTPLYLRAISCSEDDFRVVNIPTEIAPGAQSVCSVRFRPGQNIRYDARLLIRLRESDRDTVLHLTGSGRLANSYYSASYNLWGADLKQALHNIIKDHVEFPYSSSQTDVWDILRETDEDPNNSNNVLLLYSGWSYAKNNNGGGASNWNREHVWAKSHPGFGTNPPAGTDVHHLRPTDVTVNSARGSLDFDNGGSLYTDGDGATSCRYDDDSWEPRDAVKGDVARMMYYMTVRYEGEEGYDLELVDRTGTSGPVFGKRSTLYNWHVSDPPDDFERRRNEIIYTKYQKNRNPFIDFPEFADRLPSVSGVEDHHLDGRLFTIRDTVVFNTTPPGEAAVFLVKLINTGGGPLNITSVTTEGPFAVSPGNLSLDAESVGTLSVSFSGQSLSGTYTGRLHINSDDPFEPQITRELKVRVQQPTALEPRVGSPPTRLTLYGVFPNPFNPDTRLRFYMPETGALTLKIYDTRGREVFRRVWSVLSGGLHSIPLRFDRHAAGVYFYRLNDRRAIRTGKMILLP